MKGRGAQCGDRSVGGGTGSGARELAGVGSGESVRAAAPAPGAAAPTAGDAFDAWCAARARVNALRAALLSACEQEQRCRYAAMPATRPLTPRQREVLTLVLGGSSNKEIAGALHISERTAKYHVSGLLRLYGAAGRRQLIASVPTQALTPTASIGGMSVANAGQTHN